MGIKFENGWIEDAVRRVLNKPEGDIEAEDMAKIKYLRIGGNYDDDFEIELSMVEPPKPFIDTDGGDEWICCITGDDIKRFFVEKRDKLNSPFMFGFDYEESDYDWDDATEKWEPYKESFVKGGFSDRSNYESLLGQVYKDIIHFKDVEVLRIRYLEMPDYTVFSEMKNLRALELISVTFGAADGCECLESLEQLSVWLD